MRYDPHEKFVFPLYGPTRSGKSSLIEAITARLPDTLSIIRSVTTRERRGPEDDTNYSCFFTPEQFYDRIAQGKMVQHVEYAGNLYGTDRAEVDAVLADRHGICAMTEDGIINIADAGYRVIPVQIIPLNMDLGPNVTREDESLRDIDDAVRARSTIQPMVIVINDFKESGLERAITTLHRDIVQFLLDPNPSP